MDFDNRTKNLWNERAHENWRNIISILVIIVRLLSWILRDNGNGVIHHRNDAINGSLPRFFLVYADVNYFAMTKFLRRSKVNPSFICSMRTNFFFATNRSRVSGVSANCIMEKYKTHKNVQLFVFIKVQWLFAQYTWNAMIKINPMDLIGAETHLEIIVRAFRVMKIDFNLL